MTFDPTISLGTVLTILTMIIGLGSVAYKHGVAMALLSAGHVDLKSDVASVKTDVATLSGKIEGLAVIQQRLADGKERMDDLERRMRSIETQASK